MQERQARVDEHVDALVESLLGEARRTLCYWQQVPLLCLAAQGKSGSRGPWWMAGISGRWSVYPEKEGVDLCLASGKAMTPLSGRASTEASRERVLWSGAHLRFQVAYWDGELAARTILESAQSPGRASSGSEEKALQAIARHRVGIVAGWEEMSGPLFAASEVMVSLAPEWEGSVLELARTSVASVGAHEVMDLLVMEEK